MENTTEEENYILGEIESIKIRIQDLNQALGQDSYNSLNCHLFHRLDGLYAELRSHEQEFGDLQRFNSLNPHLKR